MLFTSCGNIDNPLEELIASNAPTPEPETPVKLTSITLNKATTTILIGKTETLKVDAFAPDNASDKSVTWSSDKDAVATVDENGLVTAVAVGTAIITATAKDGSGVTDQCTVTVSISGLLSGEFSIAADKKVRFAQGNLQAKTEDYGTNWTWNFAENQWDCIGNAAGNTKVTATTPFISDNGTVDLFGWVGASSSWDEVNKYGITSSTTVDAEDGYGKNSDEALKADWGTLAISNGGNATNSGWRTLTIEEWGWLIGSSYPSPPAPGTQCRTSSAVNGVANARFAKAYLDTNSDGNGDIHGVILFPDNYSHPDDVADPTGINKDDNTSWDANTYNAADWGKMEAAGCVFLPAVGYRNVTTVYTTSTYYWSSSPNTSNAHAAFYFFFNNYNLNTAGGDVRYYGCSVRLVQDVH
jgi:hypothetical protein